MRKERLRREAAFLDQFGVQVAREEERGAGMKYLWILGLALLVMG